MMFPPLLLHFKFCRQIMRCSVLCFHFQRYTISAGFQTSSVIIIFLYNTSAKAKKDRRSKADFAPTMVRVTGLEPAAS